MTDDDFTATIGRLDAELDALGAAETAVDVPQAIDWDGWGREAVNSVLRAMWSHVELGPDLRPVEAVWRVPEWRSA